MKFLNFLRFLAFLAPFFLTVPTWAQESVPAVCSSEAQAVQDGLGSIKATTVSQQEEIHEIRSGFEALVKAIGESPETAAHMRMELDVRLEAFKVRSRHNTPRIKDLHGRIASLMKCHGIKAPANGTVKVR